MIDLNAPMVNSDIPPTDKRAWVGINAIWVKNVLQYRGLDDSDITLPEQILNAGAPVMVAATPVYSNSNGNSAPTPMMAAPVAQVPAPVNMSGVTNWRDHWGADYAVWTDYIVTLVRAKSLEQAKTAIMGDHQLQADSVLTAAVLDGSFWNQVDFVKEVGGVLV